MPRQTKNKRVIFPDGFKLEIKAEDAANFIDVGVLAGGGTITLNWEERQLDAGNYEDLINEAWKPTVAFSPSAILNFDPKVIVSLFPGLLETSLASGSAYPYPDENVDFVGGNHLTLKKCTIKLTHYTKDASENPTDVDIDWQFTLYNCTVDAGGSFNFKGVNEDGLSEVTVSFTGKPDPANAGRLFNFFRAND